MSTSELISSLEATVGKTYVLTKESKTAYYRSGFRSGFGGAAAVVFPGNLAEAMAGHSEVCGCEVRDHHAGHKTGLTEGSGPSGFGYHRDVAIVNIARIRKIILLDGGKQVLAFPGATLHELEQILKPLGRAPHSVIGSTTIGATIVGGIANNAGGALCKRGSSYSELASYRQVDEEGKLNLVNHLGIKNLGETPEEIFVSLEQGHIPDEDLEGLDKLASDRGYGNRIRNLDADVPNRYNAQPDFLKSAGVRGNRYFIPRER